MAVVINLIIIASCINKTNNSPCPHYTSIPEPSLLQGRSVMVTLAINSLNVDINLMESDNLVTY